MKKANKILILSAFLLTFIVTKQINVMQDTEEIWKDVVGYEGLYRISSKGRVFICRTAQIKAAHGRNRYLSVLLSKNAVTKNYSIHRLVAVAFIGNPDCKPQVNHINGIKTDNRVENLEWNTHQENITHSIKNNLKRVAIGSKCRAAKLDNQKVLSVRDMSSKFTPDKLGEMFGVTGSTIRRIIARKIWRHI